MNEVTKRSKIFIAVLVLGWTLFGFFVIYNPMKTELVGTLYKYYGEIANSKYISLETHVDKSIEGARSVSSRTMIRDVIVEYQKGNMSLEQLQVFTQPKFIDGVNALNNVVSATRYVDQEIVAQFKENSNSFVPLDEFGEEGQVSANFIVKGEDVFLSAISPILLKDQVIGIDKIVFNFTDFVNSSDAKVRTTFLLNNQEYQLLLLDSKQLLQGKGYKLFEKNKTIYFAKPIQNGFCYVVETSEAELFSPLNQLKRTIPMFGGAIFAITLLFLYFFIIRFARVKLDVSEKSRDRYKQMLEKDELTGAHSKAFLEYWKAQMLNSDELYSIAMTDIDEFKKINDNFGHVSGDQALKKIVEIMLQELREDDFVIRFGGDEFLLLLRHSKKEASEHVLNRIQLKIGECAEFDFKISISYGICELRNKNEFNNALVIADQRMYASKQFKKSKM
jgi:diguanylate cyclase (GGDEF)-like protein